MIHEFSLQTLGNHGQQAATSRLCRSQEVIGQIGRSLSAASSNSRPQKSPPFARELPPAMGLQGNVCHFISSIDLSYFSLYSLQTKGFNVSDMFNDRTQDHFHANSKLFVVEGNIGSGKVCSRNIKLLPLFIFFTLIHRIFLSQLWRRNWLNSSVCCTCPSSRWTISSSTDTETTWENSTIWLVYPPFWDHVIWSVLILRLGPMLTKLIFQFPERFRIPDVEMFYKNPMSDMSAVMQERIFSCRFDQYLNALAHIMNTG